MAGYDVKCGSYCEAHPKQSEDFPAGPVIGVPCLCCRGHGFNP